MDRPEIVLAAMAASKGAVHTPVQMQKLLFVIDRKISQDVGGPHFNFEPYDYGPFDQGVYQVLEQLAKNGDVEIDVNAGTRRRTYRLTPQGQRTGDALLSSKVSTAVGQYITRLSEWIRRQTFAELVSAIYRAYPEMRANSVFR